MCVFRRRLLTTALLGLSLLCWQTSVLLAQTPPPNPNFRLPGQVQGNQFMQPANPQVPVVAPSALPNAPVGGANPYLNPVLGNPAATTATISTPFMSSGGGTGSLVNPSLPYPPYNPYNPYLPYYDPYAGFLMGVASVTTANAQYVSTIQQARIIREQANQAAIDTRRRLFDQIRYERMSQPTPEEIRVREMETALNRSRRNPPLAEIWSGEALNNLYNNLANLQAKGYKGPRVDLDEDVLKHITVSTGTGGNIGLLKDGGKLQWPASLQRPEFAEAEEKLGRLLPDAIREVKFNNPLAGNVAKDIEANITLLEDNLSNSVNDLKPSQYIEARRYLNFLRAGFKTLQSDNAADYLNGKYSARGKTVAELIKYMTDNGLKFGAATPGDEGAYRALYYALLGYDDGISQVAAGRPGN